jgi:hypothetical protein
MRRDRRSRFPELLTAVLGALVIGCGGGTKGAPVDGAAGQSGSGGTGGAAGVGGSNGGSGGSTGGSAGGTGGSAAGAGGGLAGSGGSAGGTGGSGGTAGHDGGASPDGSTDARKDGPVVNPTITMLTPSTLPYGLAGSFTLLVDGKDFPPDPWISFEANSWPATVVSATRLSVDIPGIALGGTARQAAVAVKNQAPPLVDSNILYFTVTAPP